jgi:hypothetical protein
MEVVEDDLFGILLNILWQFIRIASVRVWFTQIRHVPGVDDFTTWCDMC